MKNIVWKIILILAILALCLFAVYPPKEKVRLGKDLQGGTSLIYLVNIPDTAGDKQALLAQTIEVLKERVDPRGILDISMQPLGADRIEIVMPLPNDEVRALRREFDEQLSQLLASAEIRETDLDQSMRQGELVKDFGGSDPQRATQFEALQKAYNDLVGARQALNDAKQSQADPSALNTLEQAAADAEFEYENAREAVLKTSLERSRIVRTLGLPTERETKKGVTGKNELDESGNPIMQESQREIALTALKTDFPHLASQLDATVAVFDAYRAKRTTLDDPEDLMRLLRGAGVLEFRIAVQNTRPEGVNIQELRQQLAESGPDNIDSSIARWFPINELKQWYESPEELAMLEANPESFFAGRGSLVAAAYQGQYYLLLYTTPTKSMTHDAGTKWSVEKTTRDLDPLGRPAVGFTLDAAGGQLMSRLTGPHVNHPMAIVLDGQVYSAPNLNSQIGDSGIIQGDFSEPEINYLTRVLAAGALEARLSDEPIAINTLGPSLGADNLARGMKAFVLSVIVTVAIMLGYYFLAGVIANIALLINAIIIFGVMALIDGTFTLPGLAGIALSIAMAVDANVLIYERIREEIINNKEDLRTAIRLGYQRALNAIIDGNVAHLITCVVLLYTATTEVKGFALTMILGVVATLFTALFITRVLFAFYTESFKARSLPMLPTVFPGIHKALEPHVNWFNKRNVFRVVSGAACILSLMLVWTRGSNMLDTEFRGGLAMTMQTRAARPGEPATERTQNEPARLLLSRPQVEAEVRAIGEEAGADQPILKQLESATVLTVGEMTRDFQASRFQIKVGSPPGAESEATITDTVKGAVVAQFGDRLDVTPDLAFRGRENPSHQAYTYPIEDETLGVNINRPEYTENVARYRGGVAVVVDEISPAVTTQSAEARIARLREQPDFARARSRDVEVIGLTPANPANPDSGYSAIAVLVYDPALSQRAVDFEQWDRELAGPEWKLISTAMARGSSLQEVSSFSPAMARTLAANALVAVVLSLIGMLVYIWVRFGSLRYSIATVVAVTHNVIICLGALALTHWLAGTSFAAMINLGEFRIDLNVIAALLTIIGYSLNDTIVILDRIRENRGKRLTVTPEIVNNSINQTFSRTVLTGGSTIIASIILYVLGGTGIQPFAYTFLIGLLVGTYSSVAIAAPLVIGGPPRAEESPLSEVKLHRPVRTGTVAGAPA